MNPNDPNRPCAYDWVLGIVLFLSALGGFIGVMAAIAHAFR